MFYWSWSWSTRTHGFCRKIYAKVTGASKKDFEMRLNVEDAMLKMVSLKELKHSKEFYAKDMVAYMLPYLQKYTQEQIKPKDHDKKYVQYTDYYAINAAQSKLID